MAKLLNQVIAQENDVKKHAEDAVKETLSIFSKPQLVTGLQRTYEPKTDQDEPLPPETTEVQMTALDALNNLVSELTRLFDHTALKDWTNMSAMADVVVNGQTLISKAPAVYLLFLEKQLGMLESVIRKTPILDPSERWKQDGATDKWVTDPVKQNRTKKAYRSHILYEATKDHPAQVQAYTEDVVAGEWTTVKSSGAMRRPDQQAMLRRVRELQAAVKAAREEANTTEVDEHAVGEALLKYVLTG